MQLSPVEEGSAFAVREATACTVTCLFSTDTSQLALRHCNRLNHLACLDGNRRLNKGPAKKKVTQRERSLAGLGKNVRR